MYNITVQYGSDRHPLSFSSQPTIGTVKGNSTARAVLGYGDNIKALVRGVEQDDSTLLNDGATVVIETRANQKAS